MHKDEAASGFEVLSDPNRVKIMKLTYLMNGLSYDDYLERITEDEVKLALDLKILVNNNFLFENGDNYTVNKEYLNELLTFITTPCKCAK